MLREEEDVADDPYIRHSKSNAALLKTAVLVQFFFFFKKRYHFQHRIMRRPSQEVQCTKLSNTLV